MNERCLNLLHGKSKQTIPSITFRLKIFILTYVNEPLKVNKRKWKGVLKIPKIAGTILFPQGLTAGGD